MDITKSLQDDIVKIQNELITAIQNHQVLVLRQNVSPSDNIKTQIEEVQRHIICLGESQKLLVSRLRNELNNSQSLRLNNKKKEPHHERSHLKPGSENDRFNNRPKNTELNRSLLIKNANNRDRSLLKTAHASDSDICDRNNVLPKERQPSVDSSSEENRTPPCQSPVNGSSDFEQRGVKRPVTESHHNLSPSKRPKSTLQATPRPSSPVPARPKALDAITSSSEESLDSLLSQQPTETENKIDFALALGLITKEVFNKIIKKKSERRRRRVNNHHHQHHLYNNLWDLTVLQKRTRLKEPEADEGDDGVRDCSTPLSDCDNLCFVCRKPGELRECRVCQTGCHSSCVSNRVCPACTHQAPPSPSSPAVEEKKKKLEELRSNNKELHKSVAKLRERAKELSASLVRQTAAVNQLIAKEDKLNESIKKLKDFVTYIQAPSRPES